ncbi:hypothetical protein QR680_001810 [Steinernema hermaphroditum]|uniref:DNA mismatch repair protein S5 domain-containing protein n=1 Tax=Steinernema hermaphroditum TaxID=289476 RepID=A0AA39GZZ3_9BILA|nr:hypothetical protein QR680_001810 [Steinernema hermaphroditum]
MSTSDPHRLESPECSSRPTIKHLDYEVSRKICVGQVIINLAGACKELVDNSLDAGATVIEIKAKEYGHESLEISDNGCGISPDDFDALCKPHSTSKISNVDDFRTLETFGFRGEALNALSAIRYQLQLVVVDVHLEQGLTSIIRVILYRAKVFLVNMAHP